MSDHDVAPPSQPPLLEALGEPPSAVRPGLAGVPSPVTHPGVSGSPSANGTGAHRSASLIEPRPAKGLLGHAAAGGANRNRSTVILFLIAALIGLFAITWSLAYRFGHQSGQKSILSHTDPQDAAVITGQNTSELPPTAGNTAPRGSEGGKGSPEARSGPAAPVSTAGMPPIACADPRKPGYNYLEICPLTWRDAEPAVQFLQASGIRATAIPLDGKKVDLSKPQPNNRFLVLVDQPFASGAGFKAAKTEMDALKAEVRRLGKKWQSQHRGASDFGDPMFRLQQGK